MKNRTGETFTAVFARVAHAKAFVEHIETNPAAWYLTDLKRTSKVVTWVCERDSDGYHLSDMLEAVGAFGSAPIGPKATLNGITAPVSY